MIKYLLGIVFVGILFCHGYLCVWYNEKDIKKENVELRNQISVLQNENKKIVRASAKPTPNPNWLIKKSSRRGVHVPHLRLQIRAVLDYLGLPNKADWERLVLLTIAAESDCGYYTRQAKGPAKGIVQLEIPTEKDVLAFYRIKRPELYKKIRSLRVPAKLNIHEAEYNTAYAISMCIGEYLRRGYSPHGATRTDLAKAWKKHYNTYLGKGTVERALAAVDEHGISL